MRPKLDPDGAKKLLAEAGYPNGFEVGMDCPNDRYVNDEAICQAVVGMLARIGVKVNLQRPAQGAVLRQGAEARRLQDLVLPARLDARLVRQPQRPVRHHGLPRRPGTNRGEANLGGYCNKKVDELTDKVLVENDADQARRPDQGGLRDRATRMSATSRCTSRRWPGACRRRSRSHSAPTTQVLLYWATKTGLRQHRRRSRRLRAPGPLVSGRLRRPPLQRQ